MSRFPADPSSSRRKSVAGTRLFIVGFVVFALAIVGNLIWQDYQKQFVYTVMVDGEVLGSVSSRQDWRDALVAGRKSTEERLGVSVILRSQVDLTRTRLVAGEKVLSSQTLAQAVETKLNFVTELVALTVDGKDVTFLRTEEEARQVLPSVLQGYRKSLAARGGTEVLSITVLEKVSVRRVEAPISRLADIQLAKRILLRGTDKVETHVVARGESLWGIAKSRSLTVDDLRRANPELKNINSLRVGQQLNLIVANPFITIRSTERYTFVRYLPFVETVREASSLWPWQSYVEKAGVYGRNQVAVEIVRTNAEETSRAFISEQPLSSPAPQSFVLGTKVFPAKAGGLIWPAPGRITSPYGWRHSEFHRGMDLGAPYGSSVLACKGGTVTFAGWQGGYGRLVIVDHGDGMVSWYAHLSGISVSEGQAVARGDTLGQVGSSGRSTGAHLHFEVHLSDEAVNPSTYYPPGG